jgi:hypothetical protein
MDDNSLVIAKSIFQKSKPENQISQIEIINIAKCHKMCLPHTATSRSGVGVLSLFYKTLVNDPGSLVLWKNGIDNSSLQLGAFASGTIDLQKTESLIKKSLSLLLFLKVAVNAVLNPLHIIAQKMWKKIIPESGIGYILTVGVTEEAKKQSPLICGKNLILILEQWFRDSNMQESWVDTEITNRKSLDFYEKMGYEEVYRGFGQVLFKKVLT